MPLDPMLPSQLDAAIDQVKFVILRLRLSHHNLIGLKRLGISDSAPPDRGFGINIDFLFPVYLCTTIPAYV
jgi:hypothetical protein